VQTELSEQSPATSTYCCWYPFQNAWAWGLQFEKEHIEGAINIPLFRPVAGNSFWDNLKKGVMKWGLAMTATGMSTVVTGLSVC
jgi:hypothetical protein